MANILRKIAGRIRNLFSRKPAKPKLRGHRGIAAGNLKRPDLESYAERVSTGHENIPEDEVEDFFAGGNPIFVHSSNLRMVQYFPDANKLMVEFKGGKAYMVSDISLDEAVSLIIAQSKGGWYWDHVRIRGTKTGSQKPVERIR